MQGLMQQVPLTLDTIFRRAERLWATKQIATVSTDVVSRVSYARWADRTRRLGCAIEALGVSSDGRVATFAWNSTNHLELYFAIPCTGRVLHTLNIRLFADQLRYIINHAEDEVIFVDRSLAAQLWPIIDDCKSVQHVVVMDDTGAAGPELPDDSRIVGYEELIADSLPHPFEVVTDENQAASMCYTSGTTGDPKGVLYSHRSVVLHSMAVCATDVLGLSEADVVLPVVPMFHANAWGLCQAAVMAGANLLFPGSDLAPDAIAKLIVQEGVTLAAGVPTIWMGAREALAGQANQLRSIVSGGSAVPQALSETYRREIGLPIIQGWGMTETSPLGSMGRIRSDRIQDGAHEQADLLATQGLAAPLVELRIADPETSTALPWDDSATGELQARGPWIASSYYRDERSSESFTDDGWLRTGDVAAISNDGYLRLVDRTKDLIKSGGEWISSVELENHLMAHPDIAEAAVIALPSTRWMERPCACVVLRPGSRLSGRDVIEFLRPRVAKWWLPDAVEFVDEIPKTSVGKFSKKDLRQLLSGRTLP